MSISRRGFIGALAAAAATVTMPLTKAKAAALDQIGFYQYGRYYGRVALDRIARRLPNGAIQFMPRDSFAVVGLIINRGGARWMTDEELALNRSNPQALIGQLRDSDTRPKAGDAKQGSTRE